MKIHITLILVILGFGINTLAQNPTGKYTNTNEYIEFKPNNIVSFKFEVTGCFGEEFYIGQGVYKLKRNKIIIDVTSHDKKYESTFIQTITPQANDNSDIKFIIQDKFNRPIKGGATLTFADISNKHTGVISDINGIALIDKDQISDSLIKISMLGYANAFIPLNEINSKEVIVTMKEGNIIFLDNKRIRLRLELDELNKSFYRRILKIK
ncbi:hypothetical protein ACE01N_04210 [Saccharicrinis sp. FJH2]|uniref:hypothetical protein n=1 Tax=Saccharicrinis sp. FJH65 TaxID=3344659 RepID=UPI0035F3D57A